MTRLVSRGGKHGRLLFTLSVLAIITVYSTVSASGETGDYIHYRLGVKYKNDQKYDKAIDEFRKVLAAYPDNYNAYFHMAEIRQNQQRTRLVIYNLKKALIYNPGWSRAQKMLAVAYEKDGQYQKAILELQQYLQTGDPAERDSIQKQINRLLNTSVTRGSSQDDTEQITADTVTGAVDHRAGVSAANPLKSSEKSIKPPPSSGVSKPSSSSEIEPLFKKMVEYYNGEKFDDALKLIRQILSIHPRHSGAYYYAGLIRYRKKQNRMAIVNFQKGLGFPELGFNAHYYLGKIYGEDKQYARAITHLFNYIEKTNYEPGKKEAQHLIESYRKSGGAAVLDAVAPGPSLSSTPGDTTSPVEQYLALEVRIDSLLAMVTTDTLSDAGAKMLGGIHAFTAGDYEKAIKEFKKILSANPSGAIAAQCLYNTGICYLKMRLYKDAGNQFQQVIERNPNNSLAANSLFLKSLTYLERSDPVTAENLLRKFIQGYRNHPWISNSFEKLGDAYGAMEQPKKAIDAYAQATALATKNADKVIMLFKQAKTYSEIGNGPRAMELFGKVIETGEKNDIFTRVPDSYYRIADELYKLKDYEKALDYYSRATRKYPSFQETPWGLFQIGSINKNLKKYQVSIDVFKDLMRRYPDDYWARQAQWKMEDAIWDHEYRAVLK